jgi:hypothetical protein
MLTACADGILPDEVRVPDSSLDNVEHKRAWEPITATAIRLSEARVP